MGVKVREKPKGSGNWWIFISHQGKRKSKQIGKDKRLAQEIAQKIQARLILGEAGIVEDKPPYPTLRAYADKWLNTEAKLKIKTSSWHMYQSILNAHLLPVMGSERLNEISKADVKQLVYDMFERGLAHNSVKKNIGCLSSMLSDACESEIIAKNPCQNIRIPKPEHKKPQRDPRPFTWDEREHFEIICQHHFPELYPIVICGFRTGARIGEMLALQWNDIDFFNRLISIQRNLTEYGISTPKTKGGERQVRMTSQLMDILKAQRKKAKAHKLKNGWDNMPEWVFFTKTGICYHYNTMRRYWQRAAEKAGLLGRNLHDMRHSYATLRLSNGDSLHEVSKEMGHSSTNITYSTYYMWLPKESGSNIDKLDAPKRTYLHPKKFLSL